MLLKFGIMAAIVATIVRGLNKIGIKSKFIKIIVYPLSIFIAYLGFGNNSSIDYIIYGIGIAFTINGSCDIYCNIKKIIDIGENNNKD